jgi:hypothetical protein
MAVVEGWLRLLGGGEEECVGSERLGDGRWGGRLYYYYLRIRPRRWREGKDVLAFNVTIRKEKSAAKVGGQSGISDEIFWVMVALFFRGLQIACPSIA